MKNVGVLTGDEMKFRKKSEVVDAMQWFKPGDSELVAKFQLRTKCTCENKDKQHGCINTFEYDMALNRIVCPGDWILTTKNGDVFKLTNEFFLDMYEEV